MRCSLGETQLLTWARMDQLCVFEVTQVVSEGLENSKHIPFHSILFYFGLRFLSGKRLNLSHKFLGIEHPFLFIDLSCRL